MSRQAFYTLLAIVCIKGVLFFVDSQPAYFLGDSEAYLATATAKYIPPDRSVLYGLLIRRIAYRARSLEAMMVLPGSNLRDCSVAALFCTEEHVCCASVAGRAVWDPLFGGTVAVAGRALCTDGVLTALV